MSVSKVYEAHLLMVEMFEEIGDTYEQDFQCASNPKTKESNDISSTNNNDDKN